MSAKGQRLRLRLFVEGVELPVIASQVQVAPNSPMVAAIQIPPLAEGTKFHPRSLVHLFFLDFYDKESPLISARGNEQHAASSPSAYQKSLENLDQPGTSLEEFEQGLSDVDNQSYKLLFAGELMGFNGRRT
jgi:hypothetical protein